MVDPVMAALAVVEVLGTGFELVVNWLLQSTLLLTTGLTLGHALRNRGSAVQSVLFRTTLVAAIACPLATWILSLAGVSGWSVELPALVAQTETTTPEAAHVATPPPESTLAASVPLESAPAAVEFNAAVVPDPSPVAPLTASLDSDTSLFSGDDELRALQSDLSSPSMDPVATATPVPVLTTFGALAIGAAITWVVVSGTLFVRLVRSWRSLLRLRGPRRLPTSRPTGSAASSRLESASRRHRCCGAPSCRAPASRGYGVRRCCCPRQTAADRCRMSSSMS